MPLDRIKARKLISGATAYARLPNGEYVTNFATQMTEALALVEDLERTVQREQGKLTVAERTLAEEREAYRKLREQAAGVESAIAALKDIASSPKGGAKKAVEALKKLGAWEEPVVAPQEPAKQLP